MAVWSWSSCKMGWRCGVCCRNVPRRRCERCQGHWEALLDFVAYLNFDWQLEEPLEVKNIIYVYTQIEPNCKWTDQTSDIVNISKPLKRRFDPNSGWTKLNIVDDWWGWFQQQCLPTVCSRWWTTLPSKSGFCGRSLVERKETAHGFHWKMPEACWRERTYLQST